MRVAKPGRVSRLHYRCGRLFKVLGWPGGAASAYRDAIAASPQWAEAHFELGDALLDSQDWGGAAAAFAESVRLRPDHHDARGNLVLALVRQGRTLEAIEALRSLARVRHQDAELYLLLGSLCRRADLYDEAVRAFRWAVNLPRPPASRRCSLGEALLGVTEWGKVLEAYDGAAALEPPAPTETPEWHSVLNQHPARTPREFRYVPGRFAPPSPASRRLSLGAGLRRLHSTVRSAFRGPALAIRYVATLGHAFSRRTPGRDFPARPDSRVNDPRHVRLGVLARRRAEPPLRAKTG
jgi:tetratricopeptide (TPR) repeat protein